MHQQKSKKIIIYLFLFIIIGSLNNKNFVNFKLTKISEIAIIGLDDSSSQKLIKNLNFLQLNNLFLLKKKELTEIIDSNTLVETYSVYKNYPSTLNIKINKATFLAQVKKDNEISIGTAGGMTRLSTGYTFLNIQEHSKYICKNFENIAKIKKFQIGKKYQFLDNIFLKVLYKNPKLMPGIFYNMFTANNEKVVKFLSNKSNFVDDIHIIMKMPKMIFIKELI